MNSTTYWFIKIAGAIIAGACILMFLFQFAMDKKEKEDEIDKFEDVWGG